MVKRVAAAFLVVAVAGVLIATFASGSGSSGDSAGQAGCAKFDSALGAGSSSTAQAEAIALVQKASVQLLKAKDPKLASAASAFVLALDDDAPQATFDKDAQAVEDRCSADGY
jgi:hypothetical protein